MKKIVLTLFLLPAMALQLLAYDRIITGRVTSAEDGSALPGASVALKGTAHETITDAEGNYKIIAPVSEGMVVFSFIGFQSKEVLIQERVIIDVSLGNDVTRLTQVTVTTQLINACEGDLHDHDHEAILPSFP